MIEAGRREKLSRKSKVFKGKGENVWVTTRSYSGEQRTAWCRRADGTAGGTRRDESLEEIDSGRLAASPLTGKRLRWLLIDSVVVILELSAGSVSSVF